jgi:outer membrane biosynthesis protein TonB
MTSHDQQTLHEALRRARERLDGLDRELQDVEAELEDLAAERQQHLVLDEVCTGLEPLGKLGAARLFWGERVADDAVEQHLRRVRGRLELFQGRLAEIEDRRQAVLDEIRRQQGDTEVLEDDLFEAQLQEERRKLEWVVEREVSDPPARPSVMPWSRGGEDDQRFRKSLAASLALSVLLGLLLPLIDLPLPERWEVAEVPDRLARLIQEERPLPPPPPREETRPKPEDPELEPEAVEAPTPEQAPKQKAESKGILAFREKFSGLARHESSARLGSQARISSSAEAAVGRPARSMVTTQAPGSSGGINLASLSRDVGGSGGQIEGVQVARATSSIAGGGGGDRPLSNGPARSRTDEEIQIVFDRHKAGLYRLYNRELRRDPTLQGQMVLRLRIEPDGSVSLCELQATDMDAPGLSAQVLARVRTFDFGAKDGIPAITILYPIDFLPAT